MKVKVENMRSPRGNYVPNQFIIRVGNTTYFQSYQTIIARRTPKDITLDRNAYDYSVTTMKYLKEFLGHNMAETRKRIASGQYRLADLNK